MDLNSFIETILRSYSDILLFTAILFFLLLILRVNRNSTLPINWPVFGMLLPFALHLNHLHDYLAQVLSASGLSFMFKGAWFTGMNMLFTSDPDNVNYVFNTHEKLYPKGKDLMDMFGSFGDCLLTAQGEKWRFHRKTMHYVLGNRKFQEHELQATRTKIESSLIPILERCAEENKAIDLQDVFLRLIFDTTCATFLGVDPACLNYDFPPIPFVKALETLEESIFYQHAFPKIIVKVLKVLNVGYPKKLALATKIVDQFVTQTIDAKIALIEKAEKSNNQKRELNSPADLLAPYSITDKSVFDELTEIRKSYKSNVKGTLLASTDTTVSSLTWFFWLLSKHPHIEKKIISELKTIWPIFDRDSLQKLVYLHGAICECLRLYPPVPFQHKSPTQTDILPSGHRVNPGTILIFHTYSMGRMESVWGKDCMEFKPERWINQKGEIKNEPAYKFFIFNCGSRICLGKDMTINKMKMVIGAMIYNFHVEVVQGHVVEPKLGIILHMKNGLMAKVNKKEVYKYVG